MLNIMDEVLRESQLSKNTRYVGGWMEPKNHIHSLLLKDLTMGRRKGYEKMRCSVWWPTSVLPLPPNEKPVLIRYAVEGKTITAWAMRDKAGYWVCPNTKKILTAPDTPIDAWMMPGE